jgi:hypothetical protein
MAMSATASPGVRCPVCAHWTPVSDRRRFVDCTCGVRLAVPAPVKRPGQGPAEWGRSAVDGLFAVARDLVRRFR